MAERGAVEMNRMGERPVAVDLFAGAGGMSLGFEQAGFDVMAAVDFDPVHLAVHERNFPWTVPVCGDVVALGAGMVRDAVREGWDLHGRAGEWDGVIDCIFGGPSCQGFSDMGKQRPDDERNDLIFAFARLVRELAPRTFVIENVPGLLFAKARERLTRLQEELRDAGYRIASTFPKPLDAADFGVPQRRRRVFIVGVSEDLPEPTHPRMLAQAVCVSDALDDLPPIEAMTALTDDELKLTPTQLAEMDVNASAYARSLRSQVGLEYRRRWNVDALTGCKGTVHADHVVHRFASLAPGQVDHKGRTRRLDGPGLAPTLRAGTGRDHGSFTAPRPIHHRQPRVITVREAARLHSFPDWFAFNRAKWHALREIGNSVPPRLAAAVAQTVVEVLSAAPKPPSEILDLGPDHLLTHSLGSAADHYGVCRTGLPPDVRRSPQIHRTGPPGKI